MDAKMEYLSLGATDELEMIKEVVSASYATMA